MSDTVRAILIGAFILAMLAIGPGLAALGVYSGPLTAYDGR